MQSSNFKLLISNRNINVEYNHKGHNDNTFKVASTKSNLSKKTLNYPRWSLVYRLFLRREYKVFQVLWEGTMVLMGSSRLSSPFLPYSFLDLKEMIFIASLSTSLSLYCFSTTCNNHIILKECIRLNTIKRQYKCWQLVTVNEEENISISIFKCLFYLI